MLSQKELNDLFDNAKETIQDIGGDFSPACLMFNNQYELRVLPLQPLFNEYPEDNDTIRDILRSLISQTNITTTVILMEATMSLEMNGVVESSPVLLLSAVDTSNNMVYLISQKITTYTKDGRINILFNDIDTNDIENIEPIPYLIDIFNNDGNTAIVNFTDHKITPPDEIDMMITNSTLPINRTLH